MPSIFDFFVQQTYKQLIDKNSQYYLPTLIKSQNPPYDPYRTSTFPSPPTLALLDGSKEICKMVGYNRQPFVIGMATTGAAITLTDVTITGLSDALLNVPSVDDGVNDATITASADFSVIPGLQPNITIAGSFEIDQACCTKDAQHQNDPCQRSDPKWDTSANGTFDAVITTSSITGKATVSILQPQNEPEVVVNSLTYTAAATAANIKITVDITSIADPDLRKHWSKYASEAFKKGSTLKAIVSGVNTAMNEQSTLDSLSNTLTKAMIAAIGSNARARRMLARHLASR